MVRQQLLNTNESASVAFCKTFHQLNKAQLISSPKESRTLCRSVDIGGQDIVIEKEKANKNKLSGKSLPTCAFYTALTSSYVLTSDLSHRFQN